MKKALLFLILLCIPLMVHAEDLNFASNAKAAILIEASTGEVLYSKNVDAKLVPASMTKMMSMLIIIESIEKGVINWNDKITVSDNASSMGGSQILLETNEKMSVKDLFKGIAIASGNDAVVALAEAIGGSEDVFVNMMNERAKQLGLQNTNFKNPHGLDAADHYSSARDMALIAKELVKHDKVLKYTSTYEDYLREGTSKKLWLVNTNKLVRFYKGVDGLKTGYTAEAGYCLTATAKKNGMRIISVVMGEPDAKTRNKEISEMLDYAFAQYKTQVLVKKNSVLGKYEMDKAKKKYVEVVPKEDLTILSKKVDKKSDATYKVKLNHLKVPMKKEESIGKLNLIQHGKCVRNIDITVKEDIQKANFIELYLRYLKDIFNGDINF